jgi:hypothetical protein
MTLISQMGAAAVVCFLLASAFAGHASRPVGVDAVRAAEAAVAFNPQPDPPGRPDEDFGFDRG